MFLEPLDLARGIVEDFGDPVLEVVVAAPGEPLADRREQVGRGPFDGGQ